MRITIVNEPNVQSLRQAYRHQPQTMIYQIEMLIVGFGRILIERRSTQERPSLRRREWHLFRFRPAEHQYAIKTQRQAHHLDDCNKQLLGYSVNQNKQSIVDSYLPTDWLQRIANMFFFMMQCSRCLSFRFPCCYVAYGLPGTIPCYTVGTYTYSWYKLEQAHQAMGSCTVQVLLYGARSGSPKL